MYLWSKLIKKARGKAVLRSNISPYSRIQSGTHCVDSKMDRYSYCGYDCSIINATIGSFVSIANNVTIGGARHPYDWVSTSPVFYADVNTSINRKFARNKRPIEKSIVIGNDVWIGAGSYISNGVHIGNGAVIAMNSVITKDIQPYTVVGGNPSKTIKMRFNDDVVEKLLLIKWWEWSEEKLNRYGSYFNDINAFLFMIEHDEVAHE